MAKVALTCRICRQTVKVYDHEVDEFDGCCPSCFKAIEDANTPPAPVATATAVKARPAKQGPALLTVEERMLKCLERIDRSTSTIRIIVAIYFWLSVIGAALVVLGMLANMGRR